MTVDTVCCMKLLFVGQHCGLQRSYHFYVQGQSIDKTGHSMYTDTRDWRRKDCLLGKLMAVEPGYVVLNRGAMY